MPQNFDFWTKKTPFSIFVDPAHCLGFVGDIHHRKDGIRIDDPDDPDGSIVNRYIDRLRGISCFYTYMSDLGDIRNQNGTYTTGWTGFIESYARVPPEDRRNIMLNVQEYWTLEALYKPNFYSTKIDPENIAGVTFGYGPDTSYYNLSDADGITLPSVEQWRNDPQVIDEFARQAAMNAPHLSGGLTPGSEGTTIATFKAVAKRFYNDMAAYVKSRGTECVIQYGDFGTSLMQSDGVPRVALRSQNAANGRSWWRREFWYPNLYDSITYSKEKGILKDLADASLSADLYGGSVYNWFPNIGDAGAVGAWYTPLDRLIANGGGSSVASSDFNLDDLNYWAAKGAGALMHEYYNYVDDLATSQSNPAYKKGCAMIVQLDAPVISQAGAAGGGLYAAQKWGYMKDPTLAADIDIFGAFGATDDNVPNLRKPDQIWVWSSAWYNNKLLFECGTGNAGDATPLFGNDELTARFGILTARSQVEKRIFQRPMMETTPGAGGFTSESEILQTWGTSNTTPHAQTIRLQWLERNTLPNVYWDARIGEQYTEGVSNNVRFWSPATGNCLPSPCVLDKTSPIAAYLNFNNDIYKNDVRVAFKKWVSDQNVQAIERAYERLNSILFTPAAQEKKPTLYADPDTLLGWLPYETGYTGTTANSYKNRVLKAATPYTLISYGSGVFHDGVTAPNHYEATKRYFDASYGITAHYEVQAVYQPSSTYWLYTDGIRGGKSLPPYASRAVMFNIEYPWLELFGQRSSDSTTITSVMNRADVITEFARQASFGAAAAPYLFPSGHPEGGLTPGSTQTNLGVYRKVGARLWNDISEYAKSNSTYLNTAKTVLHYAGGAFISDHGVPRSGIRSAANTVPPFMSYWARNGNDCGGVPCLGSFDDLYNTNTFTADISAMYASQVSADAVSVAWYNPYPSASDWAAGATFWFGDYGIPQRKSADGSSMSHTYAFGDLLYWQSKDLASQAGRFRKALIDSGSLNADSGKKFAAVITPVLAYEGGELLPYQFNHWSGSRRDAEIAGAVDVISALAKPDVYNQFARPVDEIWVWDQSYYYWWDIPTKSTYTSNYTVAPTAWPSSDPWHGRQTIWARNMLEKVLFGRPAYPTELKELLASDGISMGTNPNSYRPDIQARCGKWLFDNSLTDGWWARTGPGAENRIWHDPNDGGSKLPSPCVLTGSSPLAPWLKFNSIIRTEHVHEALRNYLSDYSCRYVEAARNTIDNIFG